MIDLPREFTKYGLSFTPQLPNLGPFFPKKSDFRHRLEPVVREAELIVCTFPTVGWYRFTMVGWMGIYLMVFVVWDGFWGWLWIGLGLQNPIGK